MKYVITYILGLVAAFGFSGCLGSIPSEESRAQIVPSLSEGEALRILGKPDDTQENSVRRLHTWEKVVVSGFRKGTLTSYDLLVDRRRDAVIQDFSYDGELREGGILLPTLKSGVGQKGISERFSLISDGMEGGFVENILGKPYSKRLSIDRGFIRLWTPDDQNLLLQGEIRLLAVQTDYRDRVVDKKVIRSPL